MTDHAPRLLVVSNPSDRTEIEAVLRGAGFEDLAFGDGGDSTFDALSSRGPDVVVLCASLDQGDARSLATAIKGQGKAAHVILVGDEVGPIQNALDASDFDVDRFIGRPIAAKALVFAVRTGVAAVRLADEESPSVPEEEVTQALSDGEVHGRAQTQSRIDAAMNLAIDDFLSDAIAALPERNDAVPKATPEAATERLSAVPNVLDAEEPTAQAFHPAQTLPFVDEALSAPPVVPDEVQEREATMVLNRDSAAPPSSAPTAAPKSGGGAFARELRKKMSAMAERLFPGEDDAELGVGVAHSAHTEIDLTSLESSGAETVVREIEANDSYIDSPFSDREASNEGTNPFIDGDVVSRMGIAQTGPLQGDVDVPRLMALAFNAGLTGRIRFTKGETEKSVYFERGRLIFASSNLPHDRMGDLLYREGKLTRAQHVRSRELVSDGSDRRMGEILVEEGFIKPRELLPAVRRHIEDISYSLFSWGEGSYTIAEGDGAALERIRLARHPAAIILEGIRRKYDLAALHRQFGSATPTLEMVDAERAAALASQMELLPSEERVTLALDGSSTLADLAAQVQSHPLSAAQVGYALVVLDAARVAVEVTQVHDPSENEDTAEITGASDVGIDRERVLAKYSLVCDADYFRLLGVRREATSFEIRRAYEASIRDYAREAFSAELRDELAEELEEIEIVLQEAFAILSNEGMRESYLRNLE